MNWTKGPIIGRGSTATVSLATTAAGALFAVKSAELSNSSFLQKEQRVLSKLSSPHIIEYIGFDIDYDDHIPMYNLFMEYAPGGTISDVIKEQGGSLDEWLIRSNTRQILMGLDYLHSNNLVHCDIKCQNMLVCKDSVKIGDLGCAKLAENGGDDASAFSGTPVFMAPEVARGEEQGFAADVWALGCAVIEMATGCNPWTGINNPVSALYAIGYSGEVPLFPAWLSVEAKDFLKRCLQRNDKERWTAKELLQHPFVNLKSGSEKIKNFQKDSPSGVLDHGFWDYLEESEPSPAPTGFMNVSGGSPVNRIRQLVEATPSCLPNWVEDEGWITVRINNIDETSKIPHQNLYWGIDDDDHDDDDNNDNDDDSNNDDETNLNLFLFSDTYVEDYSWSIRMLLVSDVNASICANMVASRFVNFKNKNDSNFKISIFGRLFLFSNSSFYFKYY